jgi:hypothetical protein
MVGQPTVQGDLRCPRCSTINAPGAAFCATCGLRLMAGAPGVPDQMVAAPGMEPVRPSPFVSAADWIKRGGEGHASEAAVRRYPGLQVIAGVLKVIAVIVAIWGVFGFIGVVNTEHLQWNFNPLDPFGSALIFDLGAPLVVALLLWAIASLMIVLIDIEAGIRRSR